MICGTIQYMKSILLKLGLFFEYLILAIWLVVGLPFIIYIIIFSAAFSYSLLEVPISKYILSSVFWLSYYIPITIILVLVIKLTYNYLHKKLVSSKKLIFSMTILLAFLLIETLVIYFLSNRQI